MSLRSVAIVSRRNRSPDKPNEDAYAVRIEADGAALAIADGVTRSRNRRGAYPNPSGAVVAARLVARTVATALILPEAERQITAAFSRANQALAQVNAENRVWERLDYREHDLWGAVATALLVRDGRAYWGHIGDSVLLHLPVAGGVVVPTPDQVAGAMDLLERCSPLDLAARGGREVFARRDLRNQPDTPHSYGVLTGETAAEAYVLSGAFAVQPGDRLALCTDGLGSLRDGPGAGGWAALAAWLRTAPAEEALQRLLDAVEAADDRRGTRSDDKTVLLATVGD